MSKIFIKFLLAGDKFMPVLHLRQPGFIYSDCGPFTKHCERIQELRESGYLRHIYKKLELVLLKLVLFMMQHILILKIKLRELF